jgi:predicted AAA+ superfamily ATPase
MFFWRDKEGREVDLILAEDGTLFPIEVKLSASPTPRDLRGVSALPRLNTPLGKGMVAFMVEEPVVINRDVEALPPEAIW